MQDHPLHAELTARFSGGLKWVECGFGLRGSNRTFAADLRQKAAALAQELLPLDDERLLHLVSFPSCILTVLPVHAETSPSHPSWYPRVHVYCVYSWLVVSNAATGEVCCKGAASICPGHKYIYVRGRP